MATHSSVLAWRIPGIGGPGGLPSMVSHRVGHDWSDLAAAAATVKNPPAMWETWVWSLGWEDPLEKGLATPSSILAWRIPRTEEPGRLQSIGLQRAKHDGATFTSLVAQQLKNLCNAGNPSLTPGWGRSPGEGIGYPFPYSWTSLVVQTEKNSSAI